MRFELSTANSSEFAGRTLVIHVGTASDPTSDDKRDDSTEAISIQPLGLVSRPVSPSKGAAGEVLEAAGCLLGREGGRTFAMPTTDPRTLTRIPTGEEGSTTVYAPAASSIVHLSADGSINVIAFISETETLALSLDVPNRQAMERHPSGAMYTLDDSGHNWFAANGPTMQLNNDGLTINGNVRVAGTMGFGALPVLPVLQGPSGIAGVPTPYIMVSLA